MSDWIFLDELLAVVPELNRRSLMMLIRSGSAPQPTRLTPKPRNPRFRRAEIGAWLAGRGLSLESTS